MLFFEPISTISLIGSFFILAFILYAFKNKDSSIFKYFLIFSLFTFTYVFCGSVEAIVDYMPLKTILFYIGSAAYPFVYGFWLIFILKYLKIDFIFKNKIYLFIILLIPILGLFGVLTNEWLHLFYSSSPMYAGVGNQCYYESGLLDTLCVFYGYMVGIIGIAVLISHRKNFSKDNRNQIYYLIFSQLLLLGGGIILNFNISPGFDIECFATTFAMIALFITFTHYRIFSPVPIAHQNFIDNICIGMLFFNKTNCLIDFNPSAGKLFGLSDDSKLKKVNDIFSNQELIDFYFSDDLLLEYHHTNDCWYEISKTVVYEEDGILGDILTINDITKIKDAENEALKSLKIVEEQKDKVIKRQKELNKSNIEKNFLLNEVHNRVINNLQLVLSILTLDKRLGLKHSDEIVESTMARVSTMSIVYQSAYDVDRLSTLDFKDFINNNIDKFISINNGSDINVELDLESGINVNADTLSPLTLILNEIISNSVSHAFEENKEDKTISISLKRTGDDSAYIIFEDNGIGLPEDLDVNNSDSIGFIILNLLTSQINGKLTKLDSNGTALKIDFLL